MQEAEDHGPRLGGDGITTLLLSNLVLIASLGLTGLLALRSAGRRGARTPVTLECDLLLVPGVRLRADGGITSDYAARLARAAQLHAEGHCRRLLLLGGVTRSGFPSEAAMGKVVLLAAGVPADAILLEERSRDTLENLVLARELIGRCEAGVIGLTSNRYHLARIEALAHGLRFDPLLCAADNHLPLRSLPRLFGEAYYLHWYHVGRIWSHATRNHKSIARIT